MTRELVRLPAGGQPWGSRVRPQPWELYKSLAHEALTAARACAFAGMLSNLIPSYNSLYTATLLVPNNILLDSLSALTPPSRTMVPTRQWSVSMKSSEPHCEVLRSPGGKPANPGLEEHTSL